MTLKKWSPGDTITARSANNKGVRKGITTELDAIATADREIGDHYYDETYKNPQVIIDATNNKRGNLKMILGADSNEVSVTGTTPTQRKDISYVKDLNGFSGNIITIIAELKTSDGTGAAANFRVIK